MAHSPKTFLIGALTNRMGKPNPSQIKVSLFIVLTTHLTQTLALKNRIFDTMAQEVKAHPHYENMILRSLCPL